jgi:hypothetical protein
VQLHAAPSAEKTVHLQENSEHRGTELVVQLLLGRRRELVAALLSRVLVWLCRGVADRVGEAVSSRRAAGEASELTPGPFADHTRTLFLAGLRDPVAGLCAK